LAFSKINPSCTFSCGSLKIVQNGKTLVGFAAEILVDALCLTSTCSEHHDVHLKFNFAANTCTITQIGLDALMQA